jgi:hypothetical protein
MDYGLKIAQSEAPGVKSRHDALNSRCPLYPRKQTFSGAPGMSAKCHKQTYAAQQKNAYSITSSARASNVGGIHFGELDRKMGQWIPSVPMPRLVLRRCLLALDENLVTVRGTDVLSGVRGDDGHRKCGTGFAIGW